jgi:hypothetical protein
MSLEVIESEKLLSIFYTMTLRQIGGALPVTVADNFESSILEFVDKHTGGEEIIYKEIQLKFRLFTLERSSGNSVPRHAFDLTLLPTLHAGLC